MMFWKAYLTTSPDADAFHSRHIDCASSATDGLRLALPGRHDFLVAHPWHASTDVMAAGVAGARPVFGTLDQFGPEPPLLQMSGMSVEIMPRSNREQDRSSRPNVGSGR